MPDSIEMQINRINLLSNMVDEESARYLGYHRKMEEWRKIEPTDWRIRPNDVPKSILKDRMKLLRQEMIKLDKML